MAITNASRLADFGSGIGTEGSVLELDNAQQRVGIGTTNPQSTLQVGVAITMDGTAGVITATSYTGSGANLTNLPAATAITGTPDIAVRNITGVAATFTGVLTYEDVTNVDSVGIVTARGGLEVGAAGVGGTVSALGHVEFVGVTTIGLGLTLTDGIQARFGDAGDLKIYHSSNESWIKNDTGTLNILNDNIFQIKSLDDSKTSAQFNAAGEVQLRYDDSVKLRTISSGVKFPEVVDIDGNVTVGSDITIGSASGIITATGFSVGDNEYITVGVGSDLAIYHDGSASYIKDAGTGSLKVCTNALRINNAANTENLITANESGAVQLFYADSSKLTTLSTGVQVTGVTSTTSFSVGPGLIQEEFDNYGTALTGTYNHDVVDHGMILYAYNNASASFVLNLRGDGSTTLNSLMHIGQSSVFTAYTGSNNTSYYMTDFQIDGASQTEEWNGGSAPTAGTGSGYDVYTFNILKTANATFKVFATFSNFN